MNDLKKVGAIMAALALIMTGAMGCTGTPSSSGNSSDLPVGTTAGTTEATDTSESSSSSTQEPTEYIPPENIEGSIEITTDKQNKLFISGFRYGTTQTHYMWESKNAVAAKAAAECIRNVSVINNQHIISFGASYMQESQGAPLDFTSLDARLTRLKMLGGEYMLTFCSAPGWMLVSNPEGKYDPESRPKEEYFDDYAQLCAEVAKRYPEVKYFQIWNEFKGFWNSSTNWWDDALYLKFYNKIYKAVKAVRPDALVGGFYMGIRGDGSEQFGFSAVDTFDPLNDKEDGNLVWESMRYWLNNKEGADFICFDRGIQGFRNSADYTVEQAFQLTKEYQAILEKIRELTDLPLIMSEFYGHRPAKSSLDMSQEYKAAHYAMIYKYMLQGARDRSYTALLWMEEEKNGVSLFTDTNAMSGGQPTKFYDMTYEFTQNFSKGHTIINSGSADESKIEVIASETRVMAINKTDSRQVVKYGDRYYEMSPFEVLFLDVI